MSAVYDTEKRISSHKLHKGELFKYRVNTLPGVLYNYIFVKITTSGDRFAKMQNPVSWRTYNDEGTEGYQSETARFELR